MCHASYGMRRLDTLRPCLQVNVTQMRWESQGVMRELGWSLCNRGFRHAAHPSGTPLSAPRIHILLILQGLAKSYFPQEASLITRVLL